MTHSIFPQPTIRWASALLVPSTIRGMWAVLLGGIFLVSPSAFCASHYIWSGALGAANGNSWTDAWKDIPDVLARGDTYYVASGNYGPHVFNAITGTAVITIKKATVADHGIEVGWNNSMGLGQALFTSAGLTWDMRLSYLTIDGMTGTNDSGHGFHVSSTALNDNSPPVYIQNGLTSSFLTMRHVEIEAPMYYNRCFFNNSFTSTSNTFQYCYFHGGQVWISYNGSSNILIERCYFKNAGSTNSSLHSAGFAAQNVQNYVLRYCTMENMVGPYVTTYFEPQCNPGNIYIYGNIFKATRPDENSSQGVLAVTASDIATNVFFYNNTCYGLHGSSPGIWGGNVSGSTIFASNNVWQACSAAPNFYGSPSGQNVREGNNVKNTGEVKFKSPGTGDFCLTSATSSGSAVPFNLDFFGVIRGADGVWDKGAVEFASVASNLPPAVSAGKNLSVSLPSNQVSLEGNASDPEGAPLSLAWSVVSGPGAVAFSSETSAVTSATFAGAGDYELRLTVSDGVNTSFSDTFVCVNLKPSPVIASFAAAMGNISGAFAVDNGTISQKITTGVAAGGRAVFNFTVPVAGNYLVKVGVNAPTTAQNSVFANIDTDPVDPLMIWDVNPVTSGFETRVLCWRGTGTSEADAINPKVFYLTAGAHSLIFVGREAGTVLQSVQIVSKMPTPTTPGNFKLGRY